MNSTASRSTTRKVGLVPSLFFGAPLTLILAGIASAAMPLAVALPLALCIGTVAGRALLKAM